MRLNIGFFLTCIFLSGCSFLRAEGESTVWHKGDSLFLEKDYKVAALAFERIYFESKDSEIKAEASLRRADCYKAIGDFQSAFKGLYRNRIPMIKSADLQYRILFQTALCAYLDGQYEQAELTLMQSVLAGSDLAKGQQTALLDILIKNELNKWDEAHELAVLYVNQFENGNPDLLHELNIIYKSKRRPKLKNPQTAMLWSVFLPGSGQIYAGYPGEGLYNFFLQASVVTTACLLISQSYYITGILGGAVLMQAFYFGGFQRAAMLTEKNNKTKRLKYNQAIRDLLLNEVH